MKTFMNIMGPIIVALNLWAAIMQFFEGSWFWPLGNVLSAIITYRVWHELHLARKE